MRLHHTPSLAGVRHELRFLELSHFGLRPGLIVVLEREPATVSAGCRSRRPGRRGRAAERTGRSSYSTVIAAAVMAVIR